MKLTNNIKHTTRSPFLAFNLGPPKTNLKNWLFVVHIVTNKTFTLSVEEKSQLCEFYENSLSEGSGKFGSLHLVQGRVWL